MNPARDAAQALRAAGRRSATAERTRRSRRAAAAAVCACLGVAALVGACASPPAPAARQDAARVALANGDAESAGNELKLAIQQNPLDAKAHFLLGCALAQRGAADQATVGFQRAIALDPSRGEAAYNVGTMMLLRGEAVAAAAWLERAAMLLPQDARPCVNLGRAYFQAGLPEWAGAAYEEAFHRDGTSRAALEGLVRLSEAGGFAEEAKEYRRLLDALPAAPASGANLGAATPAGLQQAPPDGDAGAKPPAPGAAGTADAGRKAGAGGTDIDALRALLRDHPHVTVERRGDRVAVTGWTSGPKERELLERVLAGSGADVIDLTGDDLGDSRRMIEVDATIFIIREFASESVGFDFLRFVSLNFNYFASQHANDGTGFSGPGTIGPVTIGSVSSSGQQGWLFSAGVDYDVNIANAADERVAVLARPHLTTISGTPAKFLVGGELVFRVSGINSGDIKPYPFGTTLEVVPTLLRTPGDDGAPRIHMSVHAGRTSVLELVTGVSSDDSISFDKLEVSSEAVLRTGQTLILSGLSQRESRSVESGVPILRSIPLIKYLFSQTTTVQSDTAVVILLTPRDPAFADERYRADLKEFVERRRAFVAARREGDDAVKRLRAEHPDWFQVAPNRFASHFFLMRTSDLYRSVSGLDLPVESLVLDLLDD